MRGLGREADHRHDDRHHDAFQCAEQQHAEACRERPAEFHRPHVPDRAELCGLDEPDGVDDDHRGERRIRHQAQQRGQQQHRGQGGGRRHHRCTLRLSASRTHHRGLRSTASGRHRTEERPAEVRGARSDQFPVGIDRGVGRPRERAARGDRFSETHQRDAERAGHEFGDQLQIGQGQRGKPLRDRADDRNPHRVQSQQPGRRDGAAHGHQRRRRMWPQPFHADQDRERRRRHGQRHERSLGHVLREAQDIAEESVLVDVQSEELRQLIEDDHEPDARLEPGEHRRGNEVGDETEAQQPRQQQHDADQGRQRRRGRE